VSSIWAQELTYLGGRLLARMAEVDPSHPVERLRFMARGSPAAAPVQPPPGASRAASGRRAAQENEPALSNESRRDGTIDRAGLGAAREGAREVGDERLRTAIEAALGAAAGEPPAPAPSGPSVNQKK
jgi:hypothetical protein